MTSPNTDEIFAALTALRLPHAAQRWAHRENTEESGSFDEKLRELLDSEIDGRAAHKQDRRAAQAKLPMPSANLEDLWTARDRCLPSVMLSQLATAKWVKGGEHVAITGKTGRGKTWLACALAQAALRAGHTVAYWDVPDLLAEWEAAEVSNRLHGLRRALDRADVLILDDWAVEPLEPRDVPVLRRALLDRLQKKSVVLVSPESKDAWRAWLGDSYVADSLVDRFVHASHGIELKGPSLRR